MPWRERLQAVRLVYNDEEEDGPCVPLKTGGPEEREVAINSSLPVQNAHNVAMAINQRLGDVPPAVGRVTIAPRATDSTEGLPIIWRRRYRGDVVWAVRARDTPRLWEIIGVNPHRALPRSIETPSGATATVVQATCCEIINLCSSDDSDDDDEAERRPLPTRPTAAVVVA